MKKVFKQLSNAITCAADTQNSEELHQLEALVRNALARGDINLPQARELEADIENGQSFSSQAVYLDEGFAARSERTLDELENA